MGATTRPRPTMSCAHTVIGGCLGRVGVSCSRPAVHGGLATHSVRVPPGQPELPEVIVCALAGDIRPGKKCVDQAFACLCMRGRGRKLVAIQTEAHACQQQSRVVYLAGSASGTLSAQPPKSECVRQLVANIRSRPTFLAIVLASSSNMTRARSAAVSLGGGSRPSVGLKTACLGLDCHEFSLAPSHA